MAHHNLVKALLTGILALVSLPVSAASEFTRARSLEPTALKLCERNGELEELRLCEVGGINNLVRRADAALRKVLVTARPATAVLLKRDQAWFGELVASAAEFNRSGPDETEERNLFFGDLLQERVATLEAITFPRNGIVGQWASVFATVDVSAAEGGAYRIVVSTRFMHVERSIDREKCELRALVRPSAGGWLAGKGEAAKPAEDANKPAEGVRVPQQPIKIRRQGETLRVVIYDDEAGEKDDVDWSLCDGVGQMTATYFPLGKVEDASSAGPSGIGFVAPSFDCSRVATATEEEICADPELAENDVRLNRAWTRLLPRLDEATRRALTADQRGYVESQGSQYPEFLNPAWDKLLSHVHHTSYARDKVRRLQRERIAVLEGFEENRRGFAGLWMSHTALLDVKVGKDGTLTGRGWKWEQGDWKAGCDYEIDGKVVGGTFRSDEKRTNPDTLERDHSSLVINRLDDVFAKKRGDSNGTDEPKCRRHMSNSSTARLFPVRPSPDINNIGGSIR